MTHDKPSRPPVPGGYATWLDYAVRTFSGRQAARDEFLFDDDWSDVDGDVIRDMVHQEYHRLKECRSLRTLVFVRHGQSLANVGGVTMEHHTIPLTELGRRQAELAAELLPAASAVYSSPFLRARDSARPYCARIGQAEQVMDELHEFDTIDSDLLQGMTGLERRPIIDEYWIEGDPDKRMGPLAETFREFAQRVERFRAGTMSSLPHGAVLFGHGMWIAMLAWQVMGFSAGDSLGMKSFRRFQLGLPMPNAAVYRFTEMTPDRWTFAADEAVMRAASAMAASATSNAGVRDVAVAPSVSESPLHVDMDGFSTEPLAKGN